jgi:hypothetical protein
LGSRAEGLQHILQAADNEHDDGVHIWHSHDRVQQLTGGSREALVHVDKFITPSLADRMIQKWIHLVRWKVVLTLLRFEELGWGVGSLPTCRTSHSATPRCQALIYRNTWQNERWMTSCSRECWWRHEHQMFAVKFMSEYGRYN